METIKARVHNATMDKVASFFDSGSFTVVQELLQNCRRAGATGIDIVETDETIVITDNGNGIADPQTILDFGRSDWNSMEHENPAGMGFFSLARYVVAIESRPAGARTTWRAKIGPEHFTGGMSAEVFRTPRDPGAQTGTIITITRESGQVFDAETAARFFPLPVILNGRRLPQEEFLAGAVARKTFEGVEIGVFRDTPRTESLNFHGVIAHVPEVTLSTDPKPGGAESPLSIGYNVTQSPELELVLPRRLRIIENAFSRRLQEVATQFLFETARALNPRTVLSYQDRLKAKTMGITFNEPEPRLEEWQPTTAPGENRIGRLAPATREVGTHPLVFWADVEAADAIPLYHALQASGIKNIFEPHPDWNGYGWYEEIPKITSVRILVENDGVTTDLTQLREKDTSAEHAELLGDDSRPDGITFEMTTSGPGAATGTLRVAGEIAFSQPYGECDGELPAVLLTKKSRMSSSFLEEMIVQGYFWANDEAEADSWETQLERFKSRARMAAISLLHSPEEARKDALVSDIHDLLGYRLLNHEKIVIEQTPEGLTIDVQPAVTNVDQTTGA